MDNGRLIALGAAALLGMGALQATPAEASSLYQIDFTATVTDVTLPIPVVPVSVGDEFYGNFVYDADAVAASGASELTPGNGLVSLTFDLAGMTFTEEDDTDYPDSPAALFEDGVFDNELDYAVDGNFAIFNYTVRLDNDFSITLDDFNFPGLPGFPGVPNFASFDGPPPFGDLGVYGTLTFGDPVAVDSHVVPVPAAAWGGMALLGMLGVGRKIRRRRQGEAV